MVALTWERAYVPFLEAQGFGFVHSLPLATDPTVFSGAPNEAPSLAPAFVGNSMTDFARREWRRFEQYPEQARALASAFDENRITRDAFAQGLHACLPEAVLRSLTFEERQHAERLCFIEATRRLRVEGALRLLSEGLHVYGDDAWREYLPPERCRPYLNYTDNMPTFYNQCEVNLNITSVQMRHAVNQRVFDCPAAGGFLLSDAQPDLAALFEPGKEAVVYQTWDECRALLRYYRRNPAARATIIGNAQRRIRAEHTYAHRLRAIVAWLKARQ
jgi:spore maturation protein CgeB